MKDYVTVLRSMTQGKGTFNMEFSTMKKYRRKSWMKSQQREKHSLRVLA